MRIHCINLRVGNECRGNNKTFRICVFRDSLQLQCLPRVPFTALLQKKMCPRSLQLHCCLKNKTKQTTQPTTKFLDIDTQGMVSPSDSLNFCINCLPSCKCDHEILVMENQVVSLFLTDFQPPEGKQRDCLLQIVCRDGKTVNLCAESADDCL